MKYINDIPFSSSTDSMDNEDPRQGFIMADEDAIAVNDVSLFEDTLTGGNVIFDNNYVDNFGNIRVIKLY
jgi:hypothetical protein